jgi:3-oxoacyl-[acyl-carrier-protein] synthase II
MTRVVITGAGAVSAFGVGLSHLFNGLREGRSAVAPIGSFDAGSFETQVAAEVTRQPLDAAWVKAHGVSGIDACPGVWRDRKVVFGLLAAQEAWRMAHCAQPEQAAGLVMGLGLEQAFLEDFAPLWDGNDIDWGVPLGDGIRIRSEVDLCARLLTDVLKLKGPVVVNASACAAGGLAIAQAAAMIARGQVSMILCGGADSMVNPFGLGGMSRLGAPSPRNAVDACRPFDQRRDGLVMGEGAAMLVLESETNALQRGVPPLAVVLGHGSSQDAYRATAPRPDGAAATRAMLQALHRAGLSPHHIGYLNAHGTGTPLNDVAEARAIRATFGQHADALPVSSIKGAIGHLMAASGAIEAAACLLPLLHGVLPGTAHHQQPDPQCDIQVLGETPMHQQVDAVLSNSFGFGGQNVALVLGRYS